MRRFLTALAVAASLVFPAPGRAQPLPSYAQQSAPATETIHGRIRSVGGPFAFTLLDDRGFTDTVVLHEGTVIRPVGLSLASGMVVTVVGSNAGSAFAADEIDTSYAYDGPAPVSMYYGPGWWYPGFAYGFGPSFVLGFLTGGTFVLIRRPFVHHHPFAHPVARRFILAYPPGARAATARSGTQAARSVHGSRR